MPIREESLWLGFYWMSSRKPAFARSLLPKGCDARAKAEPKRNIVSVFENDFSSKIQQAVTGKPSMQIRCNASAISVWINLGLAQFDVIVEPFCRFRQGTDVMRLPFRYADHRDNQKHEGCYLK
jgi:hypothetical protein